MESTEHRPLTNHPEGGLRELWHISMPLMISTLATLFMIFVDRLFLARYSVDSLNAAVNAGTWAWAFFGGTGMLTAMSEVFVSQFNGAGKQSRIGSSVWQMVWVSIISIALFIPLGLWASPYIFYSSPYLSLQTDYFEMLMLFGPFYALMTALSGFFIGRGKTRVLIWIAIVANILNITFDWLLIFGVKGFIPEMGIKGAAIATCFGYIFQAVVLLYLFLKKKYREKFGTMNYQFNKELFGKSIRIGAPQGIFFMLEMVGFAVFYQLMTSLSPLHITISSICQSILILLSFFLDGLNRGVAALSGNFIGAKRFEMIKKVLKSGIVLQAIFSLGLFFAFFFFSEAILHLFFPEDLESAKLFADPSLSAHQTLIICLACSLFYLSFEGIRWIFAGILTAAGDTLFLLIAGSLSVWGMLILPIYLFVVRYQLDVTYAWMICLGYSLLACMIYGARFFKGSWKKIDLL